MFYMFTAKKSSFLKNYLFYIKATTEGPCLKPYNYFVLKFQTKD